MKRIPRFRSANGQGRGKGVQRVKAKARASIGVVRKRRGEEVRGRMGSFINSFNPSATGWRSP